jgi:hypothetical protein
MGSVIKVLVVIIVFAGIITWGASVVRATFQYATVHSPTLPPITVSTNQASTGLIANAVSSQINKTSVTGTVLIDASSGVAGIPYIKYTDSKGHIATKQLIFDDVRGCSSYAGDFPCVNRSETGAYPKVVNGALITVTGAMYEDRFIVDTITYQ